MKKLIIAASILGTAAYVHAQGNIQVYSISATFSAYTSTANYSTAGTATGGTLTKTPTTAFGFDYVLLAEPYSAALTGTPTLAQLGAMSVAVTGITNYLVAGGIAGPGHNVGAPTLLTSSWTAAQTSYADGTGTEDTYALVGWDAALGTSWQQVYTEMSTGTATAGNVFGSTTFGAGYTGGGPNSLPAPDIFGVSSGEPNGIAAGPILYQTAPEPTTIALGAMGAASLLALRRKKA